MRPDINSIKSFRAALGEARAPGQRPEPEIRHLAKNPSYDENFVWTVLGTLASYGAENLQALRYNAIK